MTGSYLLLGRLVLRPVLAEPGRSLLTVLAVALGVAVVVAIDLAGQAAAGSFHSSLESLAGNNDLVIRGTGGIDQRVLGRLAQIPQPFVFSPRIEDFASVGGRGEALPFIGLDLIANGRAFSSGGDVLPAENSIFAGAPLRLKRGEHVQLLINDQLQGFTVAGVLPETAGRVFLADIGVAQKATGKEGKLDAINVNVPRAQSVDYWRSYLARRVPPALTVDPSGARTDENRRMLSAFRWNLHVLSYIAILVGGFLIYNTISISVVRRRPQIGVLRALGATRLAIAAAFLLEALFFSGVGSLLGLGLGRIMASGAVGLIGSTVQSLYVSSQPAAIHFTFSSLLTGVGLGLGVAFLAALAPAFEASFVAPDEAMARGRDQYNTAVGSRVTLPLAFILAGLTVVFSLLPAVNGRPLFAYVAVLCGVAATSLAMPGLVIAFTRAIAHPVRRVLGVEALIASRSLRASVARTSVLTAALATAVAMTASIGIMVGSFRETVSLWMENQLRADFYLRPSGYASADRYPTMKVDVADAIERIPGVATVDRFRAYPITFENMPATLAGGETAGGLRFFPGASRESILPQWRSGDYVLISEPFANKHHLSREDFITLPLGGRERRFRISGIYYDYSSERGFVVLHRKTLLKYLPDTAVSNLAVYLNSGADAGNVRAAIDQVISGRAVLVFSHPALRRAAIEVFDRTFRITYALEAVAVFVAVMGIAGALLAMVIDRRREFGLLRCLGAGREQIRKIILCEAGLLGLMANAAGLLLGSALSLILVFVINKQSFGWTIQFHWPVALLLLALTGIYVATVLAGLYPSRAAVRVQPLEVLHEN